MLKRGFSMAFIMLVISILGFASFGTVVKKTVADGDLAEGINIEKPEVKTVKSTKNDNLTISGTVTTPQGIDIEMSLIRLDGKELVDSAKELKSVSVPKFLLEKDFNSDREKTIVKKFSNAYEEYVKTQLEYEKSKDLLEKAKKDNKSAAKINDLKGDLDKAVENAEEALSNYQDASANYLEMTTVDIFTDVKIGTGKLPPFSKVVKDIQPGYYKLIFKRSDTNKVIKVREFEVQVPSDVSKYVLPSLIAPGENGNK